MTRPSTNASAPSIPKSIYRRPLRRPTSSISSFTNNNEIDPTLRDILAAAKKFTDRVGLTKNGKSVISSKISTTPSIKIAAEASSRRRYQPMQSQTMQPMILLNSNKKYRPKIPKRPKNAITKGKPNIYNHRKKSTTTSSTNQSKSSSDKTKYINRHAWNQNQRKAISRPYTAPKQTNIRKDKDKEQIITGVQPTSLDSSRPPSAASSLNSRKQFTRIIIPQKALQSKGIRDKINKMKTFEITANKINIIVEGLSHSKPKPSSLRKNKSGINDTNNNGSKDNMFSIKLPRTVIVAKNEARKLATTMMSLEHGNAAHDEKETTLMRKRTTKSRSIVRDLRAEDEASDDICHEKTAKLLDLRMQNLRNQCNTLGLEIKNSQKSYLERKRRNHIAKVLADAQKQVYDEKTISIMTELVHGDKHKALLMVSMTPKKAIQPIISCYTKLKNIKRNASESMTYTPT